MSEYTFRTWTKIEMAAPRPPASVPSDRRRVAGRGALGAGSVDTTAGATEPNSVTERQSMGRRILNLERVLRRLSAALPARSREFGEALIAEAEEANGRTVRTRWLLGGFRFIAAERGWLRSAGYCVGLTVSVATLITVNSVANPDIASQYCLALLMLSSALLGAAAPSRAWVAGSVLGASLAIGGLITIAAGGSLPPSMHPSGAPGAASLFILILPGLLAAYAGAGLRRLPGHDPDNG